ncbi:Protein CBG01892 [Anopheles sinensis]|uniref:Protein CBG01892 n=1 Tax=Anopheles sinensis TaxID=74873 RepID=A0A084W2P4_ANOSI|nr:Protein CBG01892 [Anopheles sinensis]
MPICILHPSTRAVSRCSGHTEGRIAFRVHLVNATSDCNASEAWKFLPRTGTEGTETENQLDAIHPMLRPVIDSGFGTGTVFLLLSGFFPFDRIHRFVRFACGFSEAFPGSGLTPDQFE